MVRGLVLDIDVLYCIVYSLALDVFIPLWFWCSTLDAFRVKLNTPCNARIGVIPIDARRRVSDLYETLNRAPMHLSRKYRADYWSFAPDLKSPTPFEMFTTPILKEYS